MQIRTLLNDRQKHKSFVFKKGHIEKIDGKSTLIVEVEERKTGRQYVAFVKEHIASAIVDPKRGMEDGQNSVSG